MTEKNLWNNYNININLIISCDMNKNQLIEPKANKIEKIYLNMERQIR